MAAPLNNDMQQYISHLISYDVIDDDLRRRNDRCDVSTRNARKESFAEEDGSTL